MSNWSEGLFIDGLAPPWSVVALEPTQGVREPEVSNALRAAHIADWTPKDVVRWRCGQSWARDPWYQANRYHPQHMKVVDVLHCTCGDEIRNWVPDDRYRYVAPDGHAVERLISAPNHLYAEGLLSFDDGSHHVTHGCLTCLRELSTLDAEPDDLEQHYCRDLAQFLYEEQQGLATDVPWNAMAFRIPVGLKVMEVGRVAGG